MSECVSAWLTLSQPRSSWSPLRCIEHTDEEHSMVAIHSQSATHTTQHTHTGCGPSRSLQPRRGAPGRGQRVAVRGNATQPEQPVVFHTRTVVSTDAVIKRPAASTRRFQIGRVCPLNVFTAAPPCLGHACQAFAVQCGCERRIPAAAVCCVCIVCVCVVWCVCECVCVCGARVRSVCAGTRKRARACGHACGSASVLHR